MTMKALATFKSKACSVSTIVLYLCGHPFALDQHEHFPDLKVLLHILQNLKWLNNYLILLDN